jgi:hypothetical protein
VTATSFNERGQNPPALSLAAQFISAHSGKSDIHKAYFWAIRCDGGEGRRPVVCHRDMAPEYFQSGGHHLGAGEDGLNYTFTSGSLVKV